MSVAEDIVVIICGLLAVIYLINPTAGIIELIPDNIPLIGNLDEAGATILLISAFRYFGVDFARLFNNRRPVGGFR